MKTTSGKYIPIAALVAALICAVVRFFQIVSITDTESGFFISGSELGGVLIYILLAVCAIVLVVLSIVGKNNNDAAFSVSSDGMGSNATRFLGASEMIGGILVGSRIFAGGSDNTVITVLTVIAAAALIVSGFVLVGRIVPPTYTGHLKLAVAVYMFFRTASFFNADLIVLNHAENLIVLMAYVLATAFILSLARFYARIETVNSRIGEIILALLTFLASAVHVLSDLIAMTAGGAAASAFVSLNPDICTALLISGTYIAVLFFTTKSKNIVPVIEDE